MSNIIIQTLNTSGMNTLRENDLCLFDVAKACLTHPKIRINNITQIYVKKKNLQRSIQHRKNNDCAMHYMSGKAGQGETE